MSAAVEYDEPRTNNASEGGNKSLAAAFSSKHPTIWIFIRQLLAFHAEMELKYSQMSQGVAPNEQQRRKWQEQERRLNDLADNYNRLRSSSSFAASVYSFINYSLLSLRR